MRWEGFFFSCRRTWLLWETHSEVFFTSVYWESAPAVAINLNSRTRRDDKASASTITTKQIGMLWCCRNSTKCIYHNNCEEVIFKRTHNALSGEQTSLLRYSHSLKRHAVHSWGENVLQTVSFSLQAWKKTTLWHVLWQAGMKELASVFIAGAAQTAKRRRQQKQRVVCTLR